MQSLAVEKKDVSRSDEAEEEGVDVPSDGSRFAAEFVADTEQEGAETLNSRVDARGLCDRLNELH